MTQDRITVPVAICAAMRWEIRPVLRALRRVRLLRASGPRTWLASGPRGQVLVFQTGIGMEAAAETTRAILTEFSVGALVNTGCAGGLSPTLGAGDTVCANELLSLGSGSYRTSIAITSGLQAAAEAAALHPATVPILTTPRGLLSPEAKSAAFASSGAFAVEMEGAAVAQAAAEAEVEIGSVRVILDPVSVAIPASSKTMFDFVTNVARRIVSVEEVKRFSVTARNAVIVDRVLGKLFTCWVRANV